MIEVNDLREQKDAPLRQDIRALGNALGQAIQRHGGHDVFEMVEYLRTSCKRLRDCTERLPEATAMEAVQLENEIRVLSQQIADTATHCNLNTAIDVIRAFTVYFHLVNTAEQYHRIRRRRVHELEKRDKLQRGSLAALIAFLQKRQLDAPEVSRLLDQLSIELFFTAHPTEATRRSLIT